MENDAPTLTLAIPAHNAAAWLPEALASVLVAQAAVDAGWLRVLLVDDGSTDATWEVMQAWQPCSGLRVDALRQPHRQGIGATRQRILQAVQTPWLLWLDADDWLGPGLLGHYHNVLNSLAQTPSGKPKAVLLFPTAQPVNHARQALGPPWEAQARPQSAWLGTLLFRNVIPSASGVCMHVPTARQLPGFRYPLCEDWDMWMQMAQVGPLMAVPEARVDIRRHLGNSTRHPDLLQATEVEILQSWCHHLGWPGVLACLARRSSRDAFASQTDADACGLLQRLGKWQASYDNLKQLIGKYPLSADAWFYLGLYFLHQRHWQAAQLAFLQALRLNPQHGAACQNRAGCFLLQGMIEEGKRQLSSVLTSFPGYLDAQYNFTMAVSAEAGAKKIAPQAIRWTWRPLRKQLLPYAGAVEKQITLNK